MNNIFKRVAVALAGWLLKVVRSEVQAQAYSPGPTEQSQTVTRYVDFVRLRPDVMEALERELPAPYAGPQTSEIMAGYLLGVQAVIKKLRDGYAVD